MSSIITKTVVENLPLTSDIVDEIDINGLSSSIMQDIRIGYDDSAKTIVLDAGSHLTTVSCIDFLKDGMLSSAELCGTLLVLKFNSDASKSEISVELSSLEEGGELTSYLNLHTGGSISGDVEIISSNFVLTSIPDGIDIYSTSNGFILAVPCSYGRPSIGSKGFYVLSVIVPNKLKVSGDIDIPQAAKDSLWSIALGSSLNAQFGKITDVSGLILEFDGTFSGLIPSYSGKTEALLTSLIISDDNALYCPTHPEVGNAMISAFNCLHAEGGGVHAIAQYSHAEGRATIAEGRYSHAEGGNGTTAGGVAAHAEGFGSKAFGNRSHAEGSETSALNYASHAEGYKTQALGNGSHAEGGWESGKNTYPGGKAEGNGSHAEGYNTWAKGNWSHAEGASVSAIGNVSHASGQKAIAKKERQFVWNGIDANYDPYESTLSAAGDGSFCINPTNGLSDVYVGNKSLDALISEKSASGLDNYVDKRTSSVVSGDIAIYLHDLSVLDGSLAVGHGNIVDGDYSFAGGNSSIASGDCSFAHGYQTNALSDNAFAEGYLTSALGERSHAEGSKTVAYGYKSHAEGGGSVTSGDMTHAEGETTSALWRGGHSEGKSTTAYMYAHAEGSETLAGYDLCASNAYKQGDTASHAEGYQTSAIARFSHAEGYKTLAGIPDANRRPIITNDATFNGERDFRIDLAAHAEGISSIATGKASHAAGIKAVAKDDYSFVWSGKSSSYLSSNGNGTFNIYPANGISGIYVNGTSLTSLIPSNATVDNKVDRKKINCTIDSTSLVSYGDSCIAKGNQSIAIGTSAYALSSKSIAFGHTISAENYYTMAFGEASKASGLYSEVVGNGSNAIAAYSYAFGKNNNANAEGARAIGLSSIANGRYSLAIGEEVSSTNSYAVAFGYRNAANGSKSFAIGNNTHADANGAISFGDSTIASASYSIAGGLSNSVLNLSEYSIAIGSSNKIEGIGSNSGVKKSFVAGTSNTIVHTKSNSRYPENIFVIGSENSISSSLASNNIFVGGNRNAVSTANNTNSFIYGRSNTLSDAGLCFVAGEALSAYNNWSTLVGIGARTTANQQFVWNGAGLVGANRYMPNDIAGSFNVKPATGLSGFFIGNDNFIQCVLSAILMMSTTLKNALKNALGLS